MFINELLNSKKGKIIISILWGLGLASLFRKICKGKSCIIYKAPFPNNIVTNVYTHDGKCYKYYTHTTRCNGIPIE